MSEPGRPESRVRSPSHQGIDLVLLAERAKDWGSQQPLDNGLFPTARHPTANTIDLHGIMATSPANNPYNAVIHDGMQVATSQASYGREPPEMKYMPPNPHHGGPNGHALAPHHQWVGLPHSEPPWSGGMGLHQSQDIKPSDIHPGTLHHRPPQHMVAPWHTSHMGGHMSPSPNGSPPLQHHYGSMNGMLHGGAQQLHQGMREMHHHQDPLHHNVHHHHPHHLGEMGVDPRHHGGPDGSEEEAPSSDDLEQFAKQFKQRRIKLGFTQADVGLALGTLYGNVFSQTTICR